MATIASWSAGTLPNVPTGSQGVTLVSAGGPAGMSWDAIQFAQQSGSVSQVRFDFTAETNIAIRAYVLTPATWPSAAQALFMCRSSGASTEARFAITGTGSPGRARLVRTGGTTEADSVNNTISTNTWYRVELQLDRSNGRARLGVWTMQTDVATYDTGWRTADFGSTTIRVEFGPGQTTPLTDAVRMSQLIITDDVSDWIGRAAGDSLASGPTISVSQTGNEVDLRGSTAGDGSTLTYPTPVLVSGPALLFTQPTVGVWRFTQAIGADSVYSVSVSQDDAQTASSNVTIEGLTVLPPAGTLAEWTSGNLPTVVGETVNVANIGNPYNWQAVEFIQYEGVTAQLRYDFAPVVANISARMYLRTPATGLASSQSYIMMNSAASVSEVRFAVTPDFRARLAKIGGATVAQSPANTLEPETWYRVELQVDRALGRARVGVWPLASNTALYDTDWQTDEFGATTFRIQFGPGQSTPTSPTVRIAQILVSDTVNVWQGRAATDVESPVPVINVMRPAPNLVDLRSSSSGDGTALTYPAPTYVSGEVLGYTSIVSGVWLFDQSSGVGRYEVSVQQADLLEDSEVVEIPSASSGGAVVNIAAPRRPLAEPPTSSWG